MLPVKLLHHRMHRFGTLVVALVFLLQTFAIASMPLVSVSADEDAVVICTGSGMKTVPLSQFLGVSADQAPDPHSPKATPGGMCAMCSLAHDIAITPSMCCACATDLNARAPQAPSLDEPILTGFRRIHQARAPPSNA